MPPGLRGLDKALGGGRDVKSGRSVCYTGDGGGEIQWVIYRAGDESQLLDLETRGTGKDLPLVYSFLWQEWPAGSWLYVSY